MIRNYFKIAWRSFWRQKGYSLLNVGGLSIGLTCCVIILLFVTYERSYDKFHSKSDKIFRVYQDLAEGQDWAWTGGATKHILQEEYKEVEQVVSVHRISTYISNNDATPEKITFKEEGFIYVDRGFFDIFDFPVLDGQVGNSLSEPFKLIISESAAKKYFGELSPIGKQLSTTGNYLFEITAVVKDAPENSHMQFDFVSGMPSFKSIVEYPVGAEFTSHWWPSVWTYVLLDSRESAVHMNATLPEVMKKHRAPEEVDRFRPQLQPLSDIHLRSDMSGEWGPNGSITTVYIFLAVASFILLLACINFMNLATARAVKRAKEIGVRKVIGAVRKQLVYQFFSESLLMNIAAVALALLLTDLLLPLFSIHLERNLTLNLASDASVWILLTSILLISSFLSGFYPALYLSGFKPVNALKSSHFLQGSGDIRKGLVVFQFALSVVLIFCTTVSYLQVQYFQDANLGFDKEQVLIVTAGQIAQTRYETIRNQLSTLSSVKEVTGVRNKPGIQRGWGPNVEYEGYNPNDRPWIYNQAVDYNFFDMMKVPVIAGRGFSWEIDDKGKGTLMRGQFPAFTDRNFVINESAVKFFGKTNESVIGMPLRLYTEENGQLFSDLRGVVVGVVKDFHTANLKNEIMPTCFSPTRSEFGSDINYILVKLNKGSFSSLRNELQTAWKKIVPEVPLEFSFLDEEIDNQYKDEKRLGNVISTFAAIALFISCLGLFGLSAYTVETRTKEIGVRKVLGASESIIVRLLSKDFLMLVLWGVLIALPTGWWLMNSWLNQFANRIQISPVTFVVAAGLAIGVAIITISFQSVRAAFTNPVDALKNE